MVRLITLLAALAAVAIAAVLPARGSSPPRPACAARSKSGPSSMPAMWQRKRARTRSSGMPLRAVRSSTALDSLAIASPPDANKPQAIAERRRVFSGSGQVLIDTTTSAAPAWPVLIARLAVMDGPTRLGEVDIARSLRPALIVTAAVACGSCVSWPVMFLLLRVMPLRMLVAAVEHASFVSAHDLLTGLPNRRLFHDRLEQALAPARRDGTQHRCALYGSRSLQDHQ